MKRPQHLASAGSMHGESDFIIPDTWATISCMGPLQSAYSLTRDIMDDFGAEAVHYRSLSAEPARFSELKAGMPEELERVLKQHRITNLFTHQAESINRIRSGKNIVVMTPTASGKSLIYNIPVLEAVIDDPVARALYLFPLKGLGQDQIKTLKGMAKGLGISNLAAIYDGDTTAYSRKKIRESCPNIIFSNPDMLHLAINPYHAKWGEFLSNLKFVVIDEIHTYRGVFGSHVAHVFRRLRRICNYYGSAPRFIACSATIENPGELARELTGLDFEVINKSGAPRGERHVIFLNPAENTYTTATRAFRRCIDAGLKSIAFTKSRKLTELIYRWLIQASPAYEKLVSSYRAGFLPSERRDIEQKLFSGVLKGVVSTSALELGVDIGGLDACILVGYPGSIASTWQRAGRVGRQGQDALIIMVGLPDPLDQYFMRHPEDFFERSHEAVTIDALNTTILKAHLTCASSELSLRAIDCVYDIPVVMPVIDECVTEGTLRPGVSRSIWSTPLSFPHRDVSIRGTGKVFSIFSGGRRIAEISGHRVFRETHPGAIYLHKGIQYRVEDIDMEDLLVFCNETDASYYTQPISHEEIEVMNVNISGRRVSWGNLKITHTVTGYQKKRVSNRKKIEVVDLDLPSWTFQTQGAWIMLDQNMENRIREDGRNFLGGLHAFEHAAISALPLFAMCEKADIGGISYAWYPDFETPAVFIYDGCEGGVGLTRRCINVFAQWMKATQKLIDECTCTDGCPSCVQDPQCGSGNEPLDKAGARLILESIRGELSIAASS